MFRLPIIKRGLWPNTAAGLRTSQIVLQKSVRTISVVSDRKISRNLNSGAIQLRATNQIVVARALSSSNHKNDDGKDGSMKLGVVASAGMALSLLAGKTKHVLVALKLTKATPAISMVLSSFAYSFFFGWPYAVGMVGLIFFHECGHALVMRRYGVPFSPMVFVPFMGAVIAMKEEPRNAYEEAMIAFGGPVLGSVAALGVGTVGAMTDSQLMLALADFGYMVNLFNLLPIGSMDGGRITGAVSPYFGLVGLGAGGALIYNFDVHNPLFYLIMLGGTYTTVRRVFGWDEKEKRHYYRIPGTQQAVILTGYAGLIAALIVAMTVNNRHRKTPKQLQQEQAQGWSSNGKQEDGVYDDYFK